VTVTPFGPSAAREIWLHMAATPVVDTHEHLRPPEALTLPMTPGRLLRRSYLVRSLRVSDGSPNGVGPNLEVDLEHATWQKVAPVVRRLRGSAYYRWLMAGLTALYDLAEPGLTSDTWDALSDLLPERYGTDGWLTEGLDRAGIEAVIWDPFWKTGEWRTEDRRLYPSFRIDSSLVAFHPRGTDHDGNNLVRDWADRLDIEVARLTDLEALIEAVLEANIAAGCRSLKFAWAYDRPLRIGAADRARAERAMGRAPEHVDANVRRAFEDHVLRHVLDRARDLRLVVQVHTGMARLSGSQPIDLDPLLAEYPAVTFDLFHGGYPWTRESAALAHQHPNARLNLTWLPQLSSEVTVQVVKEWVQVVPQMGRITWGGDCQTIEETYGALLAFRWAASRALGDLVDEGFFPLEDAMAIGADLCGGAGREIYRLPPAA
jgi:hypothetical protein